jgi:alpha-tubulin suppressor-like RCC1 family protein
MKMNKKYILAIMMTTIMALMSVSNLMTVDEETTFETQAEQDYSPPNPQNIKNKIYNGGSNVKLSAGEDHTCSISAFNIVRCWGELYGPIPIAIGINNATSITSGSQHSCAILVDGLVKCWGNSRVDAGSSLWDSQECSTDYYCRPFYPNLGRSLLLDCDDAPEGMEFLASQCRDRTAVAISAGRFHTCAILDEGSIKCWGYNSRGQLGDGTNTDRTSPTRIETPEINGEAAIGYTAKSITAGDYHTCALIEWSLNISTVCWGSNEKGQIRNPDSYPNDVFEPISVLDDVLTKDGYAFDNQDLNVKAIAAGGGHTCIITSTWTASFSTENQALTCWGDNSRGQLGRLIHGNSGTTGGHPMFGSTLFSQYEGYSGDETVEIGQERTIQTSIKALQVGTDHTCVLLVDRSVKCWGFIGELDHPNSNSICLGCHGHENYPEGASNISAEIIPYGAIFDLATGKRYTCLMVSAGKTVQCMGSNNFGNIGDGSYEQRNVLTPVRNSPVLATGGSHTCSINSEIGDELSKRPTCWGANSEGQLGDGTIGDLPRNLPREIVGTINKGEGYLDWNLYDNLRVDQIVSGARHSCALWRTMNVDTHQYPEIVCWGNNEDRQVNYHNVVNDVDNFVNPTLMYDYEGNGMEFSTGEYYSPDWMGDEVPRKITAGVRHTCAIFYSNVATWETSRPYHSTFYNVGKSSLKCWGNIDGQGLNSPNPIFPLLESQDLGSANTYAIDVDSGNYHVCVITNSQALKCIGLNTRGEIGDGTTDDADTWKGVDLGPGRTARQVAAGGGFTCAILDDGSVKCWGQNYRGALGDGTTTSRALPETVNLGGGTAISITAGNSFACAILSGGTAKCWGDNSKGQLGDRTVCRIYYSMLGSDFSNGCNGAGGKSEPTVVKLGSYEKIVAISAGSSHACATLYSGTVECWGNNENGQLGDGTRIDRSFSAPVKFVSISTGDDHSCAITPGGEGVRNLKCWGRATHGQLGIGFAAGNIPYTLSPTTVDLGWELGNPSSAVAVATGAAHTCAIVDDGKVKCWGYNWYGQLGVEGDDSHYTPSTVNLGDRIAIDISAGQHHTCATLDDRSLKCWGRNDRGQLGDGTTCLSGSTDFGCNGRKGKNQPSLVDLPTQYGDIQAVDGGLHHTCAIFDSGAPPNPVSTYCWGSNSKGQIGCGPMCGDQTSPIEVELWRPSSNIPTLGGDKYPIDIDVGTYHSCAILNDGTTQCWGYNYYGQIGNGNFAFTLMDSNTGSTFQSASSIEWTPSYVDTNREMTLVRGGGYHSCGVDTGGNLECWGRNNRGQLGDGSWVTRLTPVNVDEYSNDRVMDMDSGGSHTCAVLSNPFSGIGMIKCWGSNVFSQLGDGTECANSNSDPCNGDLGKSHPVGVQLELGAMIVDTQAVPGFGPPFKIDPSTMPWWNPLPEPEPGSGSPPCGSTTDVGGGLSISVHCSSQQGTTGGSNSTSSNESGNQTSCPDGTTMIAYESLLLCVSDEIDPNMLEDEEWFQNVTFAAPKVSEEGANDPSESSFFTVTGTVLLGLMLLLIGMYSNRKKKDDDFL